MLCKYFQRWVECGLEYLIFNPLEWDQNHICEKPKGRGWGQREKCSPVQLI